ncbi:NADH-quinone oxidoreductase subunit N [uncultured Defluviicoccus sp.]|uniref:NADH-quinone oxidoreductase subunit N n=1 Tax=metagenome TaxID=256318 RepID=A0A380T9Z5_9ZZZZ|nr:NADH-quinone oxidoreductase subunit N [uncultured Defluviicoccus sp.]
MADVNLPALTPAMPEILLAVAAMGLLMLGAFSRDGGEAAALRVSRQVAMLGLVALGVTLAAVLMVAKPSAAVTFEGMFILDDFAIFMKLFVLVGAALSLFMAQSYLELHRIARFEFTVLLLLATLGMLLMVSANDFLGLYLGLEMQSLALYVIAAFHRDDVRSNEAGLKYFVLGALASGLLLYGTSLIYGYTGTTSFAAIADTLHGDGALPPAGVIVGLVFVMAGLAFKISAVPFHMWTPDVYEGAPTPVTAFFSVTPKLAAIGLLLRVMLEPFGSLFGQWQQIVIFISVASMVLGAFAAISQTNIKRLMAYSSIGHVGYALIGLAVGTREGVTAVLIYMVIYIVMNLGAFACILCMRRRGQMLVNISDLAGLSKTSPAIALGLAIFMFSMVGIPPLAGFFGKLYIFLAAIKGGLFTLAIIGVLSSVVAAYYYLRIVKVMYFDEAAEPIDRDAGREAKWVILGTALLIVIFFLIPGPLVSSASTAAAALFGS